MSLEKSRQTNFDLLRSLCTFMVIVDHISGTVKREIGASMDFDAIHSVYTAIIVSLFTISKIAVPCFVMLSGAFLLANDENADFHHFYKKSWRKIGVHVAIFSAIYVCFNLSKKIIKVIFLDANPQELATPFTNLLLGIPHYHMWYMFTIIGIYILVPLLVKIKHKMTDNAFTIVSWALFLVTIPSGWTSTFLFEWGISKSVCYVGYFLIGYQIRKICQNRGLLRGASFIFAGIAIGVCLSIIGRENILGLNHVLPSLVNNFSPTIVVSSVLFFAGFSCLTISQCRKMQRLSQMSFLIYLIHGGGMGHPFSIDRT